MIHSQVSPLNSYREIATRTASPAQLVLMLYDGAIRFLEQSRLGFKEEDPLEFNRTINNNILKAQAIVNELNYSLNMEKGEECAETLRNLYNYFDRLLQESNQCKDERGVIEVIERLTVLRNAWFEMANRTEHDTVSGHFFAQMPDAA